MIKTKYYLKTNHGIVLGVVKVNEENNVLYWNEIVKLLNQFHQQNTNLKEENEQLRKQLYEMFDLFNVSGLDYHISDELEEILDE